jgi:integrase
MTVQQLFDEYIEVRSYELKEASIEKITKNFDCYILPTYKDYLIENINIKALQEWKISTEKKGLALNTKSGAFIYFRAIFSYAIKMEYLIKNPFEKLDNFKDTTSIKKKMQYYTAEEFGLFITRAKEIATERDTQFNDLSEWNYYVFFNIAFYTGLRKGEIHALKWSDIQGSYLSVERSITQKSKGKDRETRPKNKSSIRPLQLPLPLIRILEEQKQRQQLCHNYTNDFRICNSIRNSSISRKNKRYSKGLKKIRIHDFRHSHVSILANEGVNIQEVARRLGHSRIEMTWNTYCHLYPREEEKAVAVLNKVI